MTSRFRLDLLVGLASPWPVATTPSIAGPIPYRDSERMRQGPRPRSRTSRPRSASRSPTSTATTSGTSRSPRTRASARAGSTWPIVVKSATSVEPVLERDPATGKSVPIEGGYALYRKHCLHCHGVFGAGDGPTAEFLYPRPRDYRPGIFKFTSTNPTNAKPSRADLRKTLLYGLHGTSMPGFEATMTPSEIEQVIDYMTFLSMRGETETLLIDEATNADDKDAEAALADGHRRRDRPESRPRHGRTPRPRSSTRRPAGSSLDPRERPPRPRLLPRDEHDRPEARMHRAATGPTGKGNGPSFIEPEIFQDVVFRQWPLDEAIARSYRARS